MNHAPGARWANSFTFLYQFLIKINEHQWIMLLDFPGPIPSHVLMKSLLESMENAPGAPWTNSFAFPYELLSQSNGKCSWASQGQFLYMSL